MQDDLGKSSKSTSTGWQDPEPSKLIGYESVPRATVTLLGGTSDDSISSLMSHEVLVRLLRPQHQLTAIDVARLTAALGITLKFILSRGEDKSGTRAVTTAALVPAISLAFKPLVSLVGPKRRRELTPEKAASASQSEQVAATCRRLEFVRQTVANGSRPAFEVLPDGRFRPLGSRYRAVIAGDGGRALLMSDDTDITYTAEKRPIPKGAIYLWVGSPTPIKTWSAQVLLDSETDELFEHRCRWIARQAEYASNDDRKNLAKGITIIESLRQASMRDKDPHAASEALLGKGLPSCSASMIQKMRSGNYAPFDKALRSLPVEELA